MAAAAGGAGPADRPFRESLLAMLGISLVLMLSALDQTVIGNALPRIVADLDGFALYAWVATGYLLASIVTIPIFGRMGDVYGRKPFVLLAASVFTGASLLCALAPSMAWLVAGRALQGIGGGILIGTAFACVPELFPETRQRLRWQMLLSGAFSVVNAVGPTLGGVLTEYFGWRAIFYINLPVGAVALVMVARYLPRFPPLAHKHAALDWPGALLVVVALGGGQLAVEFLPRAGERTLALALAMCSLAAATGLWWWERRAPSPLLPRELFADQRLRRLFALSVLAGAIMFVLLFYMPVLLQGAYGYSPKDAGLLTTPLVRFITLGAIVNGRIVTRLRDPKRLPQTGFVLLLLGCLGLAVHRHASFVQLLGLMLCCGLGLGFILLNLTLFTQTLAAREHLGIATALLQSLRLVGAMVGTAATGALVNALYQHGVVAAFEALGHGALASLFFDPRALFDPDLAREAMRSAGVPVDVGAALVAAARGALSQAVAGALGLAVLLAVAALWQLRGLPRIDLGVGRAAAASTPDD